MQPLFAFLAEFLYPTYSPSLQFGVIFILPGSGHVFKRPDLLKPSKLLLGSLGEKLAASALANQSVNLAYERFGDHDVCASIAHS